MINSKVTDPWAPESLELFRLVPVTHRSSRIEAQGLLQGEVVMVVHKVLRIVYSVCRTVFQTQPDQTSECWFEQQLAAVGHVQGPVRAGRSTMVRELGVLEAKI